MGSPQTASYSLSRAQHDAMFSDRLSPRDCGTLACLQSIEGFDSDSMIGCRTLTRLPYATWTIRRSKGSAE
jgi:hypothetical protein